jgi:hypothetical protein
MEKKVKVTVEGFGKNSLSTLVTREEVEGRPFEEVINMVLQKPYSGEDAKTLAMIKDQMNASGGYRPVVGIGTPNKLTPIRLDEPVSKYIQPPQGISDVSVLRTSVLGIHDLG